MMMMTIVRLLVDAYVSSYRKKRPTIVLAWSMTALIGVLVIAATCRQVDSIKFVQVDL